MKENSYELSPDVDPSKNLFLLKIINKIIFLIKLQFINSMINQHEDESKKSNQSKSIIRKKMILKIK